jgi:hypothetical protein
MKTLVASAFAIGLIAAPAAAAQINRAEVAQMATTRAAKNLVTDFSAKRRKPHSVMARPVLVAPSYPGWQGADPTRGPGIGQLRELQREGRCVIDEGYGRYMGCSSM